MPFRAVVDGSVRIAGRAGTAVFLRSFEGAIEDGARLVFRSQAGTFHAVVRSVEFARVRGGETLGLMIEDLEPPQIPEGTEIASEPEP